MPMIKLNISPAEFGHVFYDPNLVHSRISINDGFNSLPPHEVKVLLLD